MYYSSPAFSSPSIWGDPQPHTADQGALIPCRAGFSSMKTSRSSVALQLPAETWVSIFKFAVDGAPREAFNIAAVCAYWHDLASKSPALWNNVYFYSDAMILPGDGCSKICPELHLLRRSLKMTRNYPWTLNITRHSFKHGIDYNRDRVDEIARLIVLAIDAKDKIPTLSQLRAEVLYAGSLETLVNLFHCEAPNLDVLQLIHRSRDQSYGTLVGGARGEMDRAHPPACKLTAPNLRHLAITVNGLHPDSLRGFASLRTLHLLGIADDASCRIHPLVLVEMVANLPQLEHLYLKGSYPDPVDFPIALERHMNDQDDNPQQRIILHALKTFYAESVRPIYLGVLFNAFDAPDLWAVHLKGAVQEEDAYATWAISRLGDPGFPSLCKLILENFCDHVFHRILPYFGGLEELVLHDLFNLHCDHCTRCPKWEEARYQYSLWEPTDGEWMCPNLKQLTISGVLRQDWWILGSQQLYDLVSNRKAASADPENGPVALEELSYHENGDEPLPGRIDYQVFHSNVNDFEIVEFQDACLLRPIL